MKTTHPQLLLKDSTPWKCTKAGRHRSLAGQSACLVNRRSWLESQQYLSTGGNALSARGWTGDPDSAVAFLNLASIAQDLRTRLSCAQSVQTSPSWTGTNTRKKNLHVAHSGTQVGSVAQWIAHWTSRLPNEAIQRLWVQSHQSRDFWHSAKPLGQQTQRLARHPYSVVKTTLLGCAVPGCWPHLWMLWSSESPLPETELAGWALA